MALKIKGTALSVALMGFLRLAKQNQGHLQWGESQGTLHTTNGGHSLGKSKTIHVPIEKQMHSSPAKEYSADLETFLKKLLSDSDTLAGIHIHCEFPILTVQVYTCSHTHKPLEKNTQIQASMATN